MRISQSLLVLLSLIALALSAVRNKRQYGYASYYNNNYHYRQPQQYGYQYRQPYWYGYQYRQPYGYSQSNYGNYGGYTQPSYGYANHNNYYRHPSVATTYYNSDGMVYSNGMDEGTLLYYDNPYRGGLGGGGILGAAGALLQSVIG